MVTVFTPTYNRRFIIDVLYQSLLKQTCFNFEWIVVDDGSVDDTESYFNDIIKNDNPFKITYVKQQNGGKHRAINKGVSLAKGEMFFIVDSDDYITEDAIEKISSWYEQVKNEDNIAAVSGMKAYKNSSDYVGDKPKIFKKRSFVDAKNTQRKKYGLLGDKAEVYLTKFLRKYPFLEFKGENFLSEDTVWNLIAFEGYYVRWFPDIIYYCDYIEGGLTQSGDKKLIDNFNGYTHAVKLRLRYLSLFDRLTCIACYYNIARQKGKDVDFVAKELKCSKFTVKFSNFLRTCKYKFKKG